MSPVRVTAFVPLSPLSVGAQNVYFAHALKMSAELFKHGREHVFLPLGGTHMLADPMGHKQYAH